MWVYLQEEAIKNWHNCSFYDHMQAQDTNPATS